MATVVTARTAALSGKFRIIIYLSLTFIIIFDCLFILVVLSFVVFARLCYGFHSSVFICVVDYFYRFSSVGVFIEYTFLGLLLPASRQYRNWQRLHPISTTMRNMNWIENAKIVSAFGRSAVGRWLFLMLHHRIYSSAIVWACLFKSESSCSMTSSRWNHLSHLPKWWASSITIEFRNKNQRCIVMWFCKNLKWNESGFFSSRQIIFFYAEIRTVGRLNNQRLYGIFVVQRDKCGW